MGCLPLEIESWWDTDGGWRNGKGGNTAEYGQIFICIFNKLKRLASRG